MKVPEPDEETPLAWTAILESTPVVDGTGETVGTVIDVLGAEDIFHGVVAKVGPTGREVVIPAESISTITNARVVTALLPEEIASLPVYQPEESFRLGIVGTIRKHLGWIRDENSQDESLH